MGKALINEVIIGLISLILQLDWIYLCGMDILKFKYPTKVI